MRHPVPFLLKAVLTQRHGEGARSQRLVEMNGRSGCEPPQDTGPENHGVASLNTREPGLEAFVCQRRGAGAGCGVGSDARDNPDVSLRRG